MTVCFEDYVVPFTLTPESFDRRFRREGMDMEASLLWYEADSPAAIVLVSRRGWTSRVAAMAVAKPYRRQGVGRFAMQRAVDDAAARGDRSIVLEVIEQNPPAIALYEAVGMRIARRIVGYERAASPGREEGLVEIDASELLREMVRETEPGMPWQLTPETLAASALPTRAYCLEGECFGLATDTPRDRFVLWAVFTRRSARGKGLARRMVEGLVHSMGGKSAFTSVDVPDDLAPGFFAKCGFKEMSISQFEMVRDF
ncbi:MAG: GNAT family N-acetyltransferase [Armatimonadetes bacterium]|nr:GNAT family N-acetyltransferase [Armatimonadota bacterium]